MVKLTQIEAANAVLAGRMVEEELGWESCTCAAHLLQTCIRRALDGSRPIQQMLAACRRVVCHFKHSNQATEELLRRERHMQLGQLKLVQDVPTRCVVYRSYIHVLRTTYNYDLPTVHSTHLVRTCYRVVPVDIACLLVLRGLFYSYLFYFTFVIYLMKKRLSQHGVRSGIRTHAYSLPGFGMIHSRMRLMISSSNCLNLQRCYHMTRLMKQNSQRMLHPGVLGQYYFSARLHLLVGNL